MDAVSDQPVPEPITPARPASGRPLVFAHRGGRAIGPENTLPAFDAGMAAGADGLELDVRLTADGVPVVIHDPDLARTTDGQGLVRAFTAEALARLDAACAFELDGGFPWRGCGVGVPRLSDVLARFPAAAVIIEMKDEDPAIAEAVVRDVRGARAAHRVCLGSFADAVVGAARAVAPEIPTSAAVHEVRAALYRSWVGLPPRRPAYRALQVPERSGRLRVVSRRFVRALHRRGLAVQVWTVNEPDDMRRLFDWGVDGIVTDVPALGVAVRDAWLAEQRP